MVYSGVRVIFKDVLSINRELWFYFGYVFAKKVEARLMGPLSS